MTKPENILLCSKTDFFYAARAPSLARLGPVTCGETPSMVPPGLVDLFKGTDQSNRLLPKVIFYQILYAIFSEITFFHATYTY